MMIVGLRPYKGTGDLARLLLNQVSHIGDPCRFLIAYDYAGYHLVCGCSHLLRTVRCE